MSEVVSLAPHCKIDDYRISWVVAGTIITAWFATLGIFLVVNITRVPLAVIVIGVWVRSFLHTGLFITTHESIHGLVSSNRQMNRVVGSVTAFLYALLPYKVLSRNHQLHHRYPATEKDPDFCLAGDCSFLMWYYHFMKQYQDGKQVCTLAIGMSLIFWGLVHVGIPILNILLFWVIPIFLSSLQLFFFGIFLPHRKTQEGYGDRHHARSNNYAVVWSFLACYHFGYHWEHHQHPNIPWYQLPRIHRKYKSIDTVKTF